MRGRNRGSKGPNPLTRAYESNGPDVKVRGTAQHIVEKYSQLARDAQSSGDPVAAEAYLQHAEHYIRIILTAQEQLRQQYGTTFQRPFDDEEDGEEDNGNGYPAGFGSSERSVGLPAPGDDDFGSQPQPFTGNYEPRGGNDEGRRERFDRGPRPERGDRPERQDRGERFDRGPRADRPDRPDYRPERQDRPDQRPERADRPDRGDRPDRRERYRGGERDYAARDGQPREPRPERVEISAESEAPAPAPRREERPEPRREPRRERRPEPAEDTGAAGLPAFLTNPVRTAPPAEAPEAPPAGPSAAEGEDLTPRPRRRRRTRAGEAPENGAETRDPTLAE
jgi:hypothetical protein